ncbi:MAG: hypothetical protein GWN81_22005, partial [Phycisphaerae bacterium]|nr:hypothetical protein [Phycisphaerae bacterium]
ITDVNGAKTGHLTLVKDITESKAALYGLFGYFYGGAAVLLAVLLGFIYTALKRVDTSITNQQRIIAESEYRLKEAQHIGQIGSWELDRASGRLILSEEVF